jgi:hypothetical protein
MLGEGGASLSTGQQRASAQTNDVEARKARRILGWLGHFPSRAQTQSQRPNGSGQC